MTRPRTVAYIRVSTEKQADLGVSLEAQREKIWQYAALYELDIVDVVVDAGVSAKTLERPGLQIALGYLDRFEAEALLVVKLDRLTRSVKDLHHLIDDYFKDGTHRLMSVGENIDTSTATGRMVLSILATVSQWEREAAAERTAAVMQHLKATGKFTGGWPPYGFSIDEDGNLIENAVEQANIILAKSLRAEGYSFREIADALGPNVRNGKPFEATQVKRMIERDAALKVA